MLKKIWLFICFILNKIISWFRSLFSKKTKTVIVNNKPIVVDKPKLPIISGTIDIISSVISNKTNTNTLKEIDDEISNLITNISSKTESEVIVEVDRIEKKINEFKEQVVTKKIENKQEEKVLNQNLKKIEKQQVTINSLKTLYVDKKVDKKIDKKVNKENKENKKNKKSINVENKEKVEEKEEKQITPNIEVIDNTPNKLIQYKDYVKESNKTLKEATKLIKIVEEELTLNKDNLDNCKYKIQEVKDKIMKIRKQYYDFKNSDLIYVIENDLSLIKIDEFEIINNSKQIDATLKKCNTILQMIEYKKNHKEVIQEKKKPTKKKVVLEEQPKVEVPKILIEIEQANNMVKKDIKEQQKEIAKIKDRILSFPIPEQKVRRLTFFDNFLLNTFKLGVSILPLKLFKNKTLGLLTTGFMLNNRIRSMRLMINPNIVIDYTYFNRRIKNEIDIINNYNTICNDSLYQISCLKNEFARLYGYNIDDEEVKQTFAKLVDLENQITYHQQNLERTKIKLRNKTKIKKYNQY